MKKINRRSFLKALGAASAAGTLAACGSSSSTASSAAGTTGSSTASGAASSASASGATTLRITWWGAQSRHEYMQQLFDLYTEQNPNIAFEGVPGSWEGYFEKLATDTATGGMPDIFQMDYMYITTYANNGTLADLSGYTSNGTLDVSSIDESLLYSGQIGGKTVGIPLSTSLMAESYDTTVIAEAGLEEPQNGWTWDEFKADCIAIKERTGKYGFSGSAVEDMNLFNHWVRSYGGQLFADDNKSLGFEDDSITADFFQFWKDLMDAGAAPNPDENEQLATLGREASPIIMHEGGFRQDWNNYVVSVAAAGNNDIKMVVPPTKEPNGKALWYKPGMFFCVADTSEHKEEAVAFINWFVNSEEANDIIMGERGTPASSKIRDYLINSGNLSEQQIAMFDFATDAASYCSAAPAPDPAGISEINTMFKNVAYTMFYGQTTAAEAAAEFRNQANSILAANN